MSTVQLQSLPPLVEKIITEIKQSAQQIHAQQVLQKIDNLFNSAVKKILAKKNLGKETIEEILQNPHSQQSKDLNAACAMFLVFKEKMLDILAKAWALLVKRAPILSLRKYAGSVVETTLAALTAALMWARKAEVEAKAHTGTNSPTFELVEKLFNNLVVLLDKHCTYLDKIATARAAVVAELTNIGIAEEKGDDVIAVLNRHMKTDVAIAIGKEALATPSSGTPLYESLFQRLNSATTAETFSRVLGEIYDGFMACVKEIGNILQVGSKVAEQGLIDELQLRTYAFEHRAIFTAAAIHNVYGHGDEAVVDKMHQTNDQLKALGFNDAHMEHTQSMDKTQEAATDSSQFSAIPRPAPPIGGRK